MKTIGAVWMLGALLVLSSCKDEGASEAGESEPKTEAESENDEEQGAKPGKGWLKLGQTSPYKADVIMTNEAPDRAVYDFGLSVKDGDEHIAGGRVRVKVKRGNRVLDLEIRGEGAEWLELLGNKAEFEDGVAKLELDLAPLIADLVIEDFLPFRFDKHKPHQRPEVFARGKISVDGTEYDLESKHQAHEVIRWVLRGITDAPIEIEGDTGAKKGRKVVVYLGKDLYALGHRVRKDGGKSFDDLKFRDVDLIALSTIRFEKLGECNYKDKKGKTFSRDRLKGYREVQVFDRRTGEKVATKVMGASAPPPCKKIIAKTDVAHSSLTRVSHTEVKKWLRKEYGSR